MVGSLRATIAAWVVLCAVGAASAQMTLQSADPVRHDRFATRPLPSDFVGFPYDFSGVGRPIDRFVNPDDEDDAVAGLGWATMISPSYFVSATHFPAGHHGVDFPGVVASPTGAGETLRFYFQNDTSLGFEDHVISNGMQIAGTDLWLGELATPVSSQIAKYPILRLSNDAAYGGLGLYTVGLARFYLEAAPESPPSETNFRVGRNRLEPGSIQSVTFGSTGDVFLYDFDNPGGVGADESYVNAGDSGGPSFSVYDGQLVLLGVHWFQFSIPNPPNPDIIGSGDTFIPRYFDDLNAGIATLSGNSSSESATFVGVPEPPSLLLLSLGGLLLLPRLIKRAQMGSRRHSSEWAIQARSASE